MGGCCQICRYDRCAASLELHHINPKEKEFSFGGIKKISILKEELRKCILLCSNCHKEVHVGVATLPETYAKLNENILVGENELRKKMRQQTSVATQSVDKRKIFLTVEELNDMLHSQFNGNKSALARSLNVSETAVRKKLAEFVQV